LKNNVLTIGESRPRMLMLLLLLLLHLVDGTNRSRLCNMLQRNMKAWR
jgi:hypothetical protein